jgi:hypothetical protein
MTVKQIFIAFYVIRATNTQYVILIDFPLQQWLNERVSVLHYRYIARLVACDSGSCYPRRY